MKMALVSLAIVVTVIAGSGSTTIAAPIDDTTRQKFSRLDVDNNGAIEPEEFHKGRKKFDRIDANGNGSIDLDEFSNRKKIKPVKKTETSGTYPYSADKTEKHSADALYFIDAHSQLDNNVDEQRVISLMNLGGVYRTILSTHKKRPWQDIPAFADAYPGRIIPAVQIKGKGYHKGPPVKFYNRLEGQTENPSFRAMAEVLIWHDSNGGKYQEIRIDFEDDMVKSAFAKAQRKGWPFIIHIEFASLDEDGKREYMTKLEAFLEAYPNQPMLMIHMGQLEDEPVRRLLAAHKNLYFLTSHASPFYQNGGKPFISMLDGNTIKPQWKKLMIAYPERFVFALDNVFSFFWTREKYLGKMDMWWRAIEDLPTDVAHAFSHGNAERLWKLEPGRKPMYPPWQAGDKYGPLEGYARSRGKRK